jgi:Domain of unknown function (DUF4286)
MVLYSVTVNVIEEIHEEWIQWMREEHVPEVMNTGCFAMHKIMKLKEPAQDGHTYSFQYYCESHEKLNEYQTNFAPALRADVENRYANKFVAFRTILDIIE